VSIPRPVILWLPVVVWAAIIFSFSAIPSLNSGLGTWDYVLRKCAHMAEYAILAILLRRAIGRDLPALLLASAYAVTDEFHQTFVPGRHGAPIDWAIDTLGALLGLVLLRARR
jgi:VanZ family protein